MRRPPALLFLLPLLLAIRPTPEAAGARPLHVAWDDDDDDDEDRTPRVDGEIHREEPGGALDAMKWWLRQRTAPGAVVPRGAHARARAAIQAMPRARRRGHGPNPPEPEPEPSMAAWQFLGPAPLDTTHGPLETPNMSPSAGRASALAIDPTDSNVMYAGYAFGGVWKTTDGGATWAPIFEGEPTLAIGSIVIDPSSPQTLYVGTGEAAFYIGYVGRGIYRSTDGGATWAKFGGDQFDGLSLPRMFLDPNSGDFYVAAVFGEAGRGQVCTNTDYDAPGQGLYRSSDGGATWQLLRAGKVADLEVDASVTPRRIFISDFTSGGYRSDDGGATWVQPTGLPTAAGSPKAKRIEFALSAADPNVVYAGLGVGSQSTVYLSTDAGQTFAEMPGAPDYCEAQCYYDNSVVADPTDPNVLYLGGSLCGVWKTSDALSAAPTWVNVSLPGQTCGTNDSKWYLGYVHPDVHALAVDPKIPANVYAVTDGGLARSKDGGDTWSQANDGVGTMQIYALCVDPKDPTVMYGGTQDNGIMKRTSADPTWRGLIAGDGGPCAIDAGDSNLVLVTSSEGAVARSVDAFTVKTPSWVFNPAPGCLPTDPGCGDRVSFIAPVVSDPNTPGTFYVGTHRLWKSTTGGNKTSWAPTSGDLTAGNASVDCANASSFPKFDDALNVIAVAAGAPGTIYTGSQAGVVSATFDGGATWTKISKAPLPARWVSGIAIDPVDPKVIHVGFSGFDEATPGAPGHVFRSPDGGATWEARDIGVDTPVNALASHPVARDLIYAGTDFGVLVSTDGGKTWTTLGDGLPAVPVYSIVYHRLTQSLIVGTHGRSAWSLPFTGALAAAPLDLSFKVTKGAGNTATLPLAVSNTDPYGSIVGYKAAVNAPWLAIDRAEGDAAGGAATNIQITVTLGAEEVGTYEAAVTLTPTTGAPITVPVHLTVESVEVPKGDTTSSGGGETSEHGDCGCRLAGAATPAPWGLASLAVLGALAARRRRRR